MNVNAKNIENNVDLNQAVPGADLVIIPDGDIPAGAQFMITLTNGQWFFRNLNGSTQTDRYNGTTAGIPYFVRSETVNGVAGASVKYELVSTYDVTRGMYAATLNTTGRYTRIGAGGTVNGNVPSSPFNVVSPLVTSTNLTYNYNGTLYEEAPYILDIQGGQSQAIAYVTFPDGVKQGLTNNNVPNPAATEVDINSTNRKAIVIPLVVRATGNADVSVNINSVIANVQSQTLYLGATQGPSAGLATVTVNNPRTAAFDFENGYIRLDELKLGSFSNGRITLTVPRGFYFGDPNLVEVNAFSGSTWGPLLTNSPARAASATANGLAGVRNFDYRVAYRQDNTLYYMYQDKNQTVLDIDILNLNRATTMYGSLVFTGIRVFAEANAPDGAITGTVNGKEWDSSYVPGVTLVPTLSTRLMIQQDMPITYGTKGQYASALTVTGAVPTLFTGRYDRDYDALLNNPNSTPAYRAMLESQDFEHKTARFTFSELTQYSWWGNRLTTLSLPATAKFRKIAIIGNGTNDAGQTRYLTERNALTMVDYYDANFVGATVGNGVYLNDGVRHGNVTVDGNVITLTNLTPNVDQNRAQIVFDAWISIEPGTAKTATDIKITAGAYAAPSDVSVANNVNNVTIAKAIDPVSVTVEGVNDVQIGYQFQPVGNIVMKENLADAGRPGLRRNRQVLLTITDLISTDLLFSPDAKVAVTPAANAGGLTISTLTSVTNGFANRTGSTLYGNNNINNGGTIGFTVNSESRTGVASTITLSNLQVKVDRSVPESNLAAKNYQVLVWGTAIGENFGRARDQFSNPGIKTDFAKVISAADDKAGIITSEVKLPVGESYYMKGGKTVDMPNGVAAYISPASDSVMVPVRFVANALGIKDDQIIYDDAKKSVTIIAPNAVIQFTVDSNIMTINGTQTSMITNGKTVKAELDAKTGRMYIPFRALGNALGVNVGWDAATQTASYNPIEAPKASASPAAAAK